MTETNINALCSVEAVFDGVDIEVTVEFSAGGGTFEHDELTAESRAKENQHPISAITGLQLALDGKSNVGHVHPKESIAGITILDTPEFADTQITPLALEATYTPTVWAYLVALFTDVPKSVLQHFVKIWGVVNNLAVRIGLLEDKYILKYVVPVDTIGIDLTTDKYGNAFNFVEGDKIEVIIQIKNWVGNLNNRLIFTINNKSTNIYYTGTTGVLNYIYTQGTDYNSQYSIIRIELLGMETHGVVIGHSTVNTYYPFHTNGLNDSAITSIKFIKSVAPNIPAGSIIIVRKR